MFGKKEKKIFILHAIENDMTDLAVGVFSTKRKARKYFDNVMSSFKKNHVEVKYDVNRQRHFVEANGNTFVWYVAEGDFLDRKFNPKGIKVNCVYL